MRNTFYYCISKLLIICFVTALCCCSTYRLPERSPKSVEQAQTWYYRASKAEWKRAGRAQWRAGRQAKRQARGH